MASHRPSPVALLRARHALSRRQFAKILGISADQVRGLERWQRPDPRALQLMERHIVLHFELAAGWPAALRRAQEPRQDPRQLTLFRGEGVARWN